MKSQCLTAACLLLALQLLLPTPARAEDQQEALTADGPWISSVTWLDASHLVGTKSQGLLLRPAEVVKVAVDKLEELETIGEAETSLWSVRLTGSGQLIASDYKGKLAVYADGQAQPFELESRWIRALEPTPDAGQVLAGSEDGKLILLSTAERKEVKRVDASSAAIFDIAFNPAHTQLAVAAGDGTIKLFSWPALEPQGSLSRGSEAVWSVAYSADGQRLVSGGADRRIQLWDVTAGQSIGTICKAPDWVTSLVALPNSQLLAAGCMNGSIVVVDQEVMERVPVDVALPSGIWSLALSPDGTQLAAGTRKHGFAVMPIADWITQGQQVAEAARSLQPPKPADK